MASSGTPPVFIVSDQDVGAAKARATKGRAYAGILTESESSLTWTEDPTLHGKLQQVVYGLKEVRKLKER